MALDETTCAITADDTGCTVLHVDMDAFYASVAVRDRPELRDRPVIVGGGHRGVVLSATYAAREYGVRSAMPMTRARRLCPQARVIPPDFERFGAVSAAIMETFRSVTPLVEPLSMDEAFLDVSGSLRRFPSPTQVGVYLQARIADEQRITCSVGVATTTQVAKLASRRAKPDGLVVVPPTGITAFLHPLGVEELWGVGDKTAAQLHRLGLQTVGDVAHTPESVLQRAMGPAFGARLHVLAWGGDDRHVTPRRGHDEPERSIGSDETFGRDTDDPAVVLRELLRLSTKVAGRMRAANVSGRTITLRVRFFDFTTITRSRTLRDATNQTPEIYATAADLFAALGLQRARIRLVGVRVEGLGDTATAARQLMLGQREHGWEDAERAVDRATNRFGGSAVRPATLITPRSDQSQAP
ncbi:MAG: DNA polymerase IV [Nocardioidaceae bacterium]|nr:DNA polymerase IV [Nocardioidaceae bacterium]